MALAIVNHVHEPVYNCCMPGIAAWLSKPSNRYVDLVPCRPVAHSVARELEITGIIANKSREPDRRNNMFLTALLGYLMYSVVTAAKPI